MERFEIEDSLKDEIRSRVFADGFIKLVQSVRRQGENFKISLRPVMIAGVRKFQAEMTDSSGVQARNFDEAGAAEGLEEIIAQKGARELHLITASGDLHVRVTRKGKIFASRSAKMERDAAVPLHDRVKKTPLNEFDSSFLLKAVGISDRDGKVRGSMRGKYDQVNEFLKVVKETVLPPSAEEKDALFTVVDCGCVKAYLTFALYFYLTQVVGFPKVKVVGVDRREDVISSARRTAEALDVADDVVFEEKNLEDFSVGKADLVVSLHACDTATDEALAKGVEWKSKYILSAPCCQHELNKHVASIASKTNLKSSSFAGLLRQSILRERLCDILTDAYRALILRILGFKVQVIEFVSSEATARNIMLKCVYGVKPGQSQSISEYLELRDFWGVEPWLELRLKPLLDKHLEKWN